MELYDGEPHYIAHGSVCAVCPTCERCRYDAPQGLAGSRPVVGRCGLHRPGGRQDLLFRGCGRVQVLPLRRRSKGGSRIRRDSPPQAQPARRGDRLAAGTGLVLPRDRAACGVFASDGGGIREAETRLFHQRPEDAAVRPAWMTSSCASLPRPSSLPPEIEARAIRDEESVEGKGRQGARHTCPLTPKCESPSFVR